MEPTFAVYNLGRIGWCETQAVYAALAARGNSAVVFCEPDRPFYCLGYHQSAAELLDYDYCAAHDIPVLRRELGGGLVYLHPGQYFYQVIIPKTSPFFSVNRAKFYRRFLEPVTAALNDLGVPAYYQPIADIWLSGRKISGNGAGEIGQGVVLSGNVLANFSAKGFLAGLRYPSPLYRQVVMEQVQRYVGLSAGIALGYDEVITAISRRFRRSFGDFREAEVDAGLSRDIFEIGQKYRATAWNYPCSKNVPQLVSLKIAEAINVDYAPICRDGLWWDLVGVWAKGSYTKILARKSDLTDGSSTRL